MEKEDVGSDHVKKPYKSQEVNENGKHGENYNRDLVIVKDDEHEQGHKGHAIEDLK